MKLYYAPGACSLSVHIALAESGLPFDAEKINLRAQPRLTADGTDFAAINNKGYVPALVLDNGEVLTEGPAIVQYIADQVPAKRLAPANGTLERYRLQEWLNFISTEIHKGFAPLWNPAASEAEKTGAWDKLSKRLDWLAPQLAGRDYLLGDYSVADGYLFTCLNWTKPLQRSLDAWPVVQQYLARVAARPAVQSALKDEGLLG